MATKKSKEVVVPVLSVKKGNEVPKLSVSGMEKVAARLRARAKEIEQLETEQKQEEKVMLEVVKSERIEAEKQGQFFKCCLVVSEDEQPVKVQFVNKFSKISTDNEPVLRDCLGELFDELYVPQVSVKVRDDISAGKLKEVLGEEKYLALFVEEKFISHRDEFMENRARLRLSLNEKTNSLIDQLVSQCAQKPSVSYK